MSRYVHIGQMNPITHEGGVAEFAQHLRYALAGNGNSVHFAHVEGLPVPYWEWIQKMINRHTTADEPLPHTMTMRHPIGEYDAVIADGYYGLGLAGKAKRLIVVCHSTYAGWVRDWAINPPPSYKKHLPWFMEAARHQERAYREADQLVSVSTSAQMELWDIYRLESTLIPLGIDTEKFKPDGLRPGTVVEVAGDDENKGCDIVRAVKEKGNIDINPLGFEGDKPERWKGYEVALLPSRHEAGSYALLEAMAMDKKVVGYRTGFLKYDVPTNFCWSTYDYHWRVFKDMILEAMQSEGRNPRQWVLENATLEMFKENWRRFLGYDSTS
jgi:glycosyltransferase involved in cell wall biosynthesis